jgi:DNA-directed RNA polymerase subunit RPC12/RpoP
VVYLVDWREFMSLKNKEYVVKHWGVKEGLLILTNQRVIYLKYDREVGRYNLEQSIPLESIKGINGSGAFWSQNVYIYTNENKYTFERIYPKEGVVKNKMPRDDFKDMVLEQIKAKTQEKMPLFIDFSFLKTYIEKGGMILTALKCPQCNAPIEMPKDGTETVCSYCGSTIYAQDIFEKIKKLLE